MQADPHYRPPAGPRPPGLIHLVLLCLAGGALLGCPHYGIGTGGTQPATTGDSTEDPIRFVDVAQAAGLRYRWSIRGKPPHNILQTIGNGCAFLDFDNDGNLDILLVGPKLAIYKGDGKGHFTDVTHETGLDRLSGHFLGCAVGDYDNDGFDDLYISGYRTGLLLHNEGVGAGEPKPSTLNPQRRFRDVTREAGLEPQPWGTSCAFADLDGDGYLDLIVCNYVQFGPGSKELCPVRGIPETCGPRVYPALRSAVYHNVAGRRFVDVTRRWGIVTSGNSLGVACADFEGRGRIGVAVANDEEPGDLFQNFRPGVFKNIGVKSGTAYASNGHNHAGMGVDWGDADNDGQLDLFVTTFSQESKNFYRGRGGGLFQDSTAAAGLEHALILYVSFGCKFLDVDNDGWLDLLVASGHVWDNPEPVVPIMTTDQPVSLLHNRGISGGAKTVNFTDAQRNPTIGQLPRILGRGLAIGDFDNDGRMDALVVNSEGAPLLLHNETQPTGHWLGLRLAGTGKSNRDAYGAMVTVSAGGRRLMRHCRADGSYLSSSESRVHVGLGQTAGVESITVRWPDGRTETRRDVPVDRYSTWIESRP